MMHIALPIVLSNLLAVAMQMTDLAFVGRIGKTELGAAALWQHHLLPAALPHARRDDRDRHAARDHLRRGAHARVRRLDRRVHRRSHHPHHPGPSIFLILVRAIRVLTSCFI